MNRVASFTEWDRAEAAFGRPALDEAMARRRRMLDDFGIAYEPMDRLHGAGFLGEAMDSAGLWTTLFNRAGLDMLCPFLDSRMMKLAMSLPPEVRYTFRRPKALLKQTLARNVPTHIATRTKLGFGQPIFEWLSPGGQLRPLLERVRPEGVPGDVVAQVKAGKPGWFAYGLVVYDVWRRLFVERSAERPAVAPKAATVGN